MRIPTATRNGIADYVVDLVDAGSAAAQGTVEIYDDSSETTLLAELSLNNPAYHTAGAQGGLGAGSQAATVGKAWMDCNTDEPEDLTPAAAGTAGYAKIVDRDGATIMDGAVGVTSSGEFIELNALGILTTVPVKITNGSLTAPAGSL